MLSIMLWWLVRLIWSRWFDEHPRHRRPRHDGLDFDDMLAAHNATSMRGKRKPRWVGDELVRMKAYCPKLGCSKLADAFNRRFAVSRGMKVSKSSVNRILRTRRHDVLQLRRDARHRLPRPISRNRTWGLDLTHVTDTSKQQRLVLGILDHGTRACIALQELNDKSSLTILRAIIAAIRRYGTPRNIRVDNDACLKSKRMRLVLALLGIRLQITAPGCPWMNGRIERFFGTFKAAIGKIAIINGEHLATKLIEFRAFYNHVRSHQHLDGRTPAEAWSGSGRAFGSGELVQLWKGTLCGYYFPLRQ